MSKRGLSDIITNVLIILLVLVAVGLIWSFVKPFLSSSLSSAGPVSDSYTARLAVLPRSISDNGNILSLTIERKAGGVNAVINKVKIILKGSTGSSRTYNCDITGIGELETAPCSVDYSVDAVALGEIVEVSLVPVFIVDGQETNGQVTDVYDVASETSTTPSQTCGNNLNDVGEACDLTAPSPLNGQTCISQGFTGGNLSCSSGCLFVTSACTSPPVATCGNGVIEDSEACDDNNLVNGDGCSSTCQVESSWQCGGSPSRCLLFNIATPIRGNLYEKQSNNFWLNFSFGVSGGPSANSCSYTSGPATQQAVPSNVSLLPCAGQSIMLRYSEICSGGSYAQNTEITTNSTASVVGTGSGAANFSTAVSNSVSKKFIVCPTSSYSVSLSAIKNGTTLTNTTQFTARACPGDVNKDGFVNSGDQGLLTVIDSNSFGSVPCPASMPFYCDGDLDGDGNVDGDGGGLDYNYFTNNYFDLRGSCRAQVSGGLCGNGIINGGEICDGSLPVGVTAGSCTAAISGFSYPGSRACINCLAGCNIGGAYCGNLNVEGSEECDDGNSNPADLCDFCSAT